MFRNQISAFPDHNGIKLEINSRRKTGKSTKMWKLNSTHLNNQWVKEESTRETRKYIEIYENEKTTYKIYGMQWKQC